VATTLRAEEPVCGGDSALIAFNADAAQADEQILTIYHNFQYHRLSLVSQSANSRVAKTCVSVTAHGIDQSSFDSFYTLSGIFRRLAYRLPQSYFSSVRAMVKLVSFIYYRVLWGFAFIHWLISILHHACAAICPSAKPCRELRIGTNFELAVIALESERLRFS